MRLYNYPGAKHGGRLGFWTESLPAAVWTPVHPMIVQVFVAVSLGYDSVGISLEGQESAFNNTTQAA